VAAAARRSTAELLCRKPDGATLTDAEIAGPVAGITHGALRGAQVAAIAMAVCIRDMTPAECLALTLAMTARGPASTGFALAQARALAESRTTPGFLRSRC
jgi:thymidine phosphorylase